MSTYHPDRWVVIEVTSGDLVYRKVFSGNYGGYLGSDTWKLSSAIESVKEDENGYEFLCQSGSTYKCHKQAFGMSAYMNSIYSSWAKALGDDAIVEVVKAYDAGK